eukprot:TRINITY_DN792_c0_g1_i1.p1 TRINITY_DN792_c0_g1~~TRINITY_DN792_c0_g1_i1.p1  ORF type:complete len:899 (-),score=250.89 TRINITY_DN792_c0_g1_i1:153-2849(-)
MSLDPGSSDTQDVCNLHSIAEEICLEAVHGATEASLRKICLDLSDEISKQKRKAKEERKEKERLVEEKGCPSVPLPPWDIRHEMHKEVCEMREWFSWRWTYLDEVIRDLEHERDEVDVLLQLFLREKEGYECEGVERVADVSKCIHEDMQKQAGEEHRVCSHVKETIQMEEQREKDSVRRFTRSMQRQRNIEASRQTPQKPEFLSPHSRVSRRSRAHRSATQASISPPVVPRPATSRADDKHSAEPSSPATSASKIKSPVAPPVSPLRRSSRIPKVYSYARQTLTTASSKAASLRDPCDTETVDPAGSRIPLSRALSERPRPSHQPSGREEEFVNPCTPRKSFRRSATHLDMDSPLYSFARSGNEHPLHPVPQLPSDAIMQRTNESLFRVYIDQNLRASIHPRVSRTEAAVLQCRWEWEEQRWAEYNLSWLRREKGSVMNPSCARTRCYPSLKRPRRYITPSDESFVLSGSTQEENIHSHHRSLDKMMRGLKFPKLMSSVSWVRESRRNLIRSQLEEDPVLEALQKAGEEIKPFPIEPYHIKEMLLPVRTRGAYERIKEECLAEKEMYCRSLDQSFLATSLKTRHSASDVTDEENKSAEEAGDENGGDGGYNGEDDGKMCATRHRGGRKKSQRRKMSRRRGFGGPGSFDAEFLAASRSRLEQIGKLKVIVRGRPSIKPQLTTPSHPSSQLSSSTVARRGSSSSVTTQRKSTAGSGRKRKSTFRKSSDYDIDSFVVAFSPTKRIPERASIFIQTPSFREISLGHHFQDEDADDGESDVPTDDEFYERLHTIRQEREHAKWTAALGLNVEKKGEKRGRKKKESSQQIMAEEGSIGKDEALAIERGVDGAEMLSDDPQEIDCETEKGDIVEDGENMVIEHEEEHNDDDGDDGDNDNERGEM